ncbi:MAG TPA: GNAT family protein [Gaiellaceae bacterium]|nr:GNAT family protein [Gaiellaceae bacterium]
MKVTPLQADDAAVLDAWRYEPPYDFYNGEDEPVKNPERFFLARDDAGDVLGFYYFEERPDAVEIGLGLRPDLTGRGLGLQFFLDGVSFAKHTFGEKRVVLNVAAFNDRAITVYRRAGFRETGRHMRRFDRWGEVEFVEMEEER